MGNVRLNKKKCQQGLDGMNLEFSFGVADMENLYLPQEELKNKAGNTIVRLDCIGGKVRAYVNAVTLHTKAIPALSTRRYFRFLRYIKWRKSKRRWWRNFTGRSGGMPTGRYRKSPTC